MNTISSTSQPEVDVQIATADENIPSDEDFRTWVAAALPPEQLGSEITIRADGVDSETAVNELVQLVEGRFGEE